MGGDGSEMGLEMGDSHRIKNLHGTTRTSPAPENPRPRSRVFGPVRQGRYPIHPKPPYRANDRQNGRSGAWGGAKDRPPSGRSPLDLGQRQRFTVNTPPPTQNPSHKPKKQIP